MAAKNPPAVIFLGKIDVGKTTIFNKVCDTSRSTDLGDFSTTRTYAKHKVFYQGKELVIFDGPGCKSKLDTYNHSHVMRHGLTHQPLNGIFIFVEYNTRIGSNMADDLWEVAKMLKPEYLDMVVMIVTKMDHFEPEGSWRSKDAIQLRIRDVFAKEHGIHNIVFSERNTEKQDLFKSMHDIVKDKTAIKLEYSEIEFLQYFELKAWKGKEMHDLYRTKTLIRELTSEFREALSDLEENRNEYSTVDFHEYVFSAIQQSNQELEDKVMSPFTKRNGDSQVNFEDYAAYIELKKLVDAAHADVRNEAKTLLSINPDDTRNWRNAIRRCQYCGEVWVKVEGCDGETTCGLLPSQGDPWGEDSYYHHLLTKVGGVWRPNKVTKKKKDRISRSTAAASAAKIGCGHQIVWKDQAILSTGEIDALFSTQELQLILSNFSSKPDFIAKKKKKEGNIPVFTELSKDGKDP